MAAKKYLAVAANGSTTETPATVVSAGAANDGDLLALDSTGRIDQSALPVGIAADTFNGVADGALSAGDMVYRSTIGIARASAAVGGHEAEGFVLAASTTGSAATMYFEGRNTAVTGLTVPNSYYLSDTTPGAITTTVVTGAGKLLQRVGTAVSTTSLNFEPDQPIVRG